MRKDISTICIALMVIGAFGTRPHCSSAQTTGKPVADANVENASTPDAAQRDGGRQARQEIIGEFEKVAPKVGDLLPEIQVLDANGKPYPLTQERGHFSVVISGCLT